jgi:hypothetical protein
MTRTDGWKLKANGWLLIREEGAGRAILRALFCVKSEGAWHCTFFWSYTISISIVPLQHIELCRFLRARHLALDQLNQTRSSARRARKKLALALYIMELNYAP